jgi:hypothetical protein
VAVTALRPLSAVTVSHAVTMVVMAVASPPSNNNSKSSNSSDLSDLRVRKLK